MSLQFNEGYFKGEGYGNYRDYPHFLQRAEWIYNYITSNSLTGKIYILGCGYGYVIKHLINLGISADRIIGLETSTYAYQEATNLGVEQSLDTTDVKDFDFSAITDIDIIISWNVLDCLLDETTAQEVVAKLNQMANLQFHIICVVDDDSDSENYIKLYYFIKNLSYWTNLFGKEEVVLIEYRTGRVWRRDTIDWKREPNWKIPLSWGRVSE